MVGEALVLGLAYLSHNRKIPGFYTQWLEFLKLQKVGPRTAAKPHKTWGWVGKKLAKFGKFLLSDNIYKVSILKHAQSVGALRINPCSVLN